MALVINAMPEIGHAMERSHVEACDHTLPFESSDSPQDSDSPVNHACDYDGCEFCLHCVCHAPLPSQQFQLSYLPVIESLSPAEIFRHLPEVYFPKFIPPQIPA